MRAQIVRSCSYAAIGKGVRHWWPSQVFLRGLRDLGIPIPVEPIDGLADQTPVQVQELIAKTNTIANDPRIRTVLGMYLSNIGSDTWEAIWGKHWDDLNPSKKGTEDEPHSSN